MSAEDDEYDLDDEVLDDAFEDDLEEGLEDFDENDEGAMSFDEDEALFSDDELEEHARQDETTNLGAQKNKFHLDIGTDKIIIFGAVIVGIIVLVFQVTTKTAEQRVEIFSSVLTMKGASDGEVFGETQSTNIATTAPQKKEEQKAFLHEPEALDKLPNNLKDGEQVGDIVIAPVDPKDVEVLRPKQGEFLKNGKVIELEQVQEPAGKFVSVIGERVQQNVPSPPPVKEENIAIQESLDREEKPINPDESRAISALNIAKKAEEKFAIEQAKQKLNFVPIDQVTVKSGSEQPPAPVQKQASAVQSAQNELMVLKREIEKLKQEKAVLEQETVSLNENNDKPQEVIMPPKVIDRAVTPPANKDLAVNDKKEVKKVDPPKVSTSKATSNNNVQNLPNWQLRAAQPNKAWVSKRGQRDMISVTVGETVRDLGRVTAITNKNGKWVVMTTNGLITQ